MKLCSPRFFFGTIALLLLTSGCSVVSEQPLSDAKKAKPDPMLVGTWREKNGKEQSTSRIHFDLRGYGYIEERKVVGHRKAGSHRDKFFITQTENAAYFNFQSSDQTDQHSTTHEPMAYRFLKYRVLADRQTLLLWTPKLAVFRQAVLDGVLKGQIDKTNLSANEDDSRDDSLDGVLLQDSPGAIIHFMEARPTREMFELTSVMRRVD